MGFEVVRHVIQFFQIVDPGRLGIGFGVAHIKISLQRNDDRLGLRLIQFCLDFFDSLQQGRQTFSQITNKGIGSSDPAIELALFGLDAFLFHGSDCRAFVSGGQ